MERAYLKGGYATLAVRPPRLTQRSKAGVLRTFAAPTPQASSPLPGPPTTSSHFGANCNRGAVRRIYGLGGTALALARGVPPSKASFLCGSGHQLVLRPALHYYRTVVVDRVRSPNAQQTLCTCVHCAHDLAGSRLRRVETRQCVARTCCVPLLCRTFLTTCSISDRKPSCVAYHGAGAFHNDQKKSRAHGETRMLLTIFR